MTNLRRPYTQAEELALTTQVDGYCPICGDWLFYEKKARSFKGYDLAHIYPLNPKPEERAELQGVVLLNADVNHPDNIVPLCTTCHRRFDKPRTRKEFEELAALKRRLIERAFQRAVMSEFPLDADISRIITRLHEIEPDASDIPALRLDARSLDQKFDDSMPSIMRQKIRHAVSDYYSQVLQDFKELERDVPSASALIYAQVRAFYLRQKKLGLPQSVVFANIVEWIKRAAEPETLEAAEIVAAFFVQNCEVFE